ncbi:pseudaminic acid cytidylyltransferase [Pedobacter ginsengisoli]|uniref:Pseudaminic acid cytidylyltransferase n=1 Tax=Pedobacter ginsengisoli TaxID=363852 RepID=A0A2D1U8R0_9SPHI|nr:pseudaminic acid cytidylyltransferase [Pedobacter ginsengisoli]ATP58003.1 pseudaminic acid cytidylyltransferase [Pedobacter ginsengisoli]
MTRLAIIPARGGSKRIPRKNIKDFLGKPIISYSIEAALKSNLFDEVMVSTDDEEIASIADSCGASVPFLRSNQNSDDFASTADVLKEVITYYEKNNRIFEYGCCIYPAAPLIASEKLTEAFQMMENSKFSTVFPVAEFSSPIQRALKVERAGVSNFFPTHMQTRTQDLERAYQDCGQFYFFKVQPFMERGFLQGENTGAIFLNDWEYQDIDNEHDWRIAEFKYQYFKQLKHE